jgi:lactoylglutathione lyase
MNTGETRMKEIAHINAISLYVEDIKRSELFYRRVFDAEIFTVSEQNIVVKMGTVLLNLLDMRVAYAPTGPERGAPPLELNIWTEDVDAVYRQLLKRGVDFLSPPIDQPWGMRNITFFDPDGHRFEIAQKIN